VPAPARTPRSAWIDAGLRAFAGGGPDAVRIEPLAKALGVTRGSFYWHFDDRGALLDALLETWERRSTDEAIEGAHDDDPRERIRRAGLRTFSRELLPVDLAVRDWARRDPTVAARLRAVDGRRMDYLREQFSLLCDDPGEVEARSLLAFSLAIGAHFIATGHDAAALAAALDHLVR
jgi:AcrR family transcriptional regulator